MNKEEKKIFLKLVADNAQTKAYRQIGIDKFSIKEHLGRIAEYERDVAEPDEIGMEELVKLIKEEEVCFDTFGNECEDPSLCEKLCLEDDEEECDDA